MERDRQAAPARARHVTTAMRAAGERRYGADRMAEERFATNLATACEAVEVVEDAEQGAVLRPTGEPGAT